MSVTDASRHQLHHHLAQVLGDEDAAVLMEHLPPVGWADVATKRDLDHLEAMIRADLEAKLGASRIDADARMGTLAADLRAEMAELRVSVSRQLWIGLTAQLGVLVAILAVLR